MMKYRKTVCGYHADYGTHDMHWDNFGGYLGQYQDNMFDGELPRLFLKPSEGRPFRSLTRVQMLFADLHAFVSARKG